MKDEQVSIKEVSMHPKRTIIFGIIIGLIIVLLFGSITYTQLKVGDFQPHLKWAQQLGDSSYLSVRAIIFFHRMVLVVRDLLPFNILARLSPLLRQIIDIKSYDISAWIVTVSAYMATFIIVFRYLKQNFAIPKNKKTSTIVAIFSLICMLVAPIFIFTFPDRLYLGYINGNPFHNPTYLLMKPFAVLFFIMSTELLFGKNSWKEVIIAGLMLFLATSAKPSFTISFLPSVVVVIIWNLKMIKKLNLRFIGVSILLTSFIVLLTQFIIMYTGSRGDQILLSPFKAILEHVPNLALVLISALLSILFPLLTIALNWRKQKDNLAVQLAVVNFVISLFIAYLFTEQTDMWSLNFWWTPMIAVFLLFLVSLPIYFNDLIEKSAQGQRLSLKSGVLSVALLLHLGCGIIFYVYSLGPVSPLL